VTHDDDTDRTVDGRTVDRRAIESTHGSNMTGRSVRFRDESGIARRGRLDGDRVVVGGRTYDVEDVDLLAPVEPTKVVGVGKTYRSQIEELGETVPERPTLFLMPPKAVVGPDATVVLPNDEDRICFEGEIGVVIGEECRDVPSAEAMDVVAGYTCVNDITNFDRVDQGLVQAKAFDCATPIGPVVAPPSSVPDDPTLELHLNGEREQRTSLSKLLFPVEELVEYASAGMTLEAGDVISTGTPAGVGPLHDGDTVEVTLDGVGTLTSHIVR
jgi:2-keto-4-pentenoate hydratase/2-oxohepta-3-ene-1,7-dioic acid hydratase in catechol pathway